MHRVKWTNPTQDPRAFQCLAFLILHVFLSEFCPKERFFKRFKPRQFGEFSNGGVTAKHLRRFLSLANLNWPEISKKLEKKIPFKVSFWSFSWVFCCPFINCLARFRNHHQYQLLQDLGRSLHQPKSSHQEHHIENSGRNLPQIQLLFHWSLDQQDVPSLRQEAISIFLTLDDWRSLALPGVVEKSVEKLGWAGHGVISWPPFPRMPSWQISRFSLRSSNPKKCGSRRPWWWRFLGGYTPQDGS